MVDEDTISCIRMASFRGGRFNELVHRVTDLEGVDARRLKEGCRGCKGIRHGGTFHDSHDTRDYRDVKVDCSVRANWTVN